MKKILLVALVATTTLATSCTSDPDTITSSQGIHEIPNNEAFASKVGDTLPEDTGGQGGYTQPPPPPRP
jgi:hypothetical protein